MSFVHRVSIPSDHPSLPGHFPGNAIVPGVVLLERVQQALHLWHADYSLTGLVQVKFSAPLRPCQEVDIVLEELRAGRLRFECRQGTQLVASGVLTVGADAGAGMDES